jgi:hypothetical protein
VLQYYVLLRSILRTRPHLRKCLTCCRHCRIFFLTRPCNAGRKDLGCPFGCKDAHRKKDSARRSVEYYKTKEGKGKKKIQNGKRCKTKADLKERQAEAERDLSSGSPDFNAEMVEYLRVVVSLIEGRRVKADEILEMLARVLRQHSMVRRRRIDYILQHLMKNAP